VASFQGNNQTSGIPPDPCIAVGPNHIMHLVNSSFRISDKRGNTIKTINASSWYSSVLSNNGAFDPRVFYDSYAQRWVMVWDSENDAAQTGYFLVSVSDDDNPIGTWFNWALPSNRYGSTLSGTWQDHETAGYDSRAYYITGRHFGFVSGYFGNAVRILPKAQFLGPTPGPISWWDFWALRDNFGLDVDQIRPSLMLSEPNEFYLVGPPSVTSGSYFALFRITNPLGTPAIACAHIPVVAWSDAPNAGQLGGGTGIETGGSNVFHEPVYRDSSLWVTHSVNNGGYAAVRYLRINPTTNTAVEDVAFGAFGFWYFYPALAVDKDKNLAITFSRSGDTQYTGAYFTWRLNTDPPGLRPAETMRAGAGNYVVLGEGRNRWGDYMGAALDPADQNNIWMFTEYAAATNNFGNWVHGVRLVPYSGSRVFLDRTSIDYGLLEVGNASDTVAVTLFNTGSSTLIVSSIARTQSQYTLLNVPSLPANLGSFDSLRFRVVFTPTAHALITDSITIVSNDATNPTTKIPLRAKGIIIGRAQVAKMYSTSSLTAPPSQLYTINASTGVPTAVGPTGVTEIHTLTIRPTTQELYGTFAGASSCTIYRMSNGFGDALPVRTFPVGNMRAIAFNRGDSLYGATTGGRLYRLNLVTGDTLPIGGATSIFYSGLAFNPVTKKLYASTRAPLSGRDNIYTINTLTGAATLVGAAGFSSRIIPGLTFNATGTLYGITGSGSQIIELITIDTATAVGTLIGSTGITGLHSLALRTDSLTTGVDEGTTAGIPTSFILDQNYPNPFNPTTQIRYGLPRQSRITMTIYNVLGQEIAQLYEGEQTAGFHTLFWNGLNGAGVAASSGIYLYRLEASGANGAGVTRSRKMMLLK